MISQIALMLLWKKKSWWILRMWLCRNEKISFYKDLKKTSYGVVTRVNHISTEVSVVVYKRNLKIDNVNSRTLLWGTTTVWFLVKVFICIYLKNEADRCLVFCEFLLQLFDIDEDNCITQEEFSSLLRSALGVRDLEVHSLFKEIDADGSGHITYGLYANYIASTTVIRLSVILEVPSFREYFVFQ